MATLHEAVFKSDNESATRLGREVRASHPGLRDAVVADARLALGGAASPSFGPPCCR